MAQKSPPTSIKGRMGRHYASTPPRLPREILLCILDCASQPVVLAMASVCRALRSAARGHRNYYLYIPLYRSTFYDARRWPNPAPHLCRALDALRCATRRGVRVALVLHVGPQQRANRISFRDELLLQPVLSAARAALRVSVFRLAVTCGPDSWVLCKRLLSHPAPRLESFAIEAYPPCPYWPLPTSKLFSGYAPRLRDVSVRGLELPHERVSAFRAVSNVRVTSILSFTTWSVVTLFPRISSLDLAIDPVLLGGSPDIDDMRLSRISLSCRSGDPKARLPFPYIFAIPVPDILVLHASGFLSVWHLSEAHWQQPQDLSLKIDCAPHPYYPKRKLHTVAFSCLGRSLKLEIGYRMTWIPALVHVSTLHLTQRAIPEFLHALPVLAQLPVLISVLVELHSIRFLPWPLDVAHDDPTILACPALREVHVVWPSVAGPHPRIGALELEIMAMCLALDSQSSPQNVGIGRRVELRLQNVDYVEAPEESSIFFVQVHDKL